MNPALRSGPRYSFDAAMASYQQALRLKPNYPEAHSNLGNALQEQGRLDEAVASCQQAIRLKPDYAEAHHNLGHRAGEAGQDRRGRGELSADPPAQTRLS